MILRRIAEAIRRQNWFTVFVETMIVVLGVFLGLQVNNWNVARQDETIAQQYIARIQEELLANQRDMRTRIVFFSTVRAHMLGALDALDDPPETLGRQFVIDSFIGSFTLLRSLGRDTYNELAAGGAGNTALDVATRQRIAQFYRVTEGTERIFYRISPYHDTLRREMPYEVQAQLRQNGCNSTFKTDETGEPLAIPPTDCKLTLTDAETSRVVASLLDANLKPDLTYALADIDLKLLLFQATIDRAQSLYDFLEGKKK